MSDSSQPGLFRSRAQGYKLKGPNLEKGQQQIQPPDPQGHRAQKPCRGRCGWQLVVWSPRLQPSVPKKSLQVYRQCLGAQSIWIGPTLGFLEHVHVCMYIILLIYIYICIYIYSIQNILYYTFIKICMCACSYMYVTLQQHEVWTIRAAAILELKYHYYSTASNLKVSSQMLATNNPNARWNLALDGP